MSDLKRVIGVQVAGQAAEPLAKVAGVQATAPAGLGRVRAVDVLLARGLRGADGPPGQDGDAATLERLTAADAKLAEMEVALTDSAQSRNEALAVTGINPAYISEAEADPPAAPDGTKGAKRDEFGNLTRLLRQGGAWVSLGPRLITYDALPEIPADRYGIKSTASDNSQALQDAITDAQEQTQFLAATLRLKPGTYTYGTTLEQYGNLSFKSSAPWGSVLNYQGTDYMLVVNTRSVNKDAGYIGGQVTSLDFDGLVFTAPNSGKGVLLGATVNKHIAFRNGYFRNIPGGYAVNGGRSSYFVTLHKMGFINTGGVRVRPESDLWTLDQCWFASSVGYDATIETVAFTIINSSFEGNSGLGINPDAADIPLAQSGNLGNILLLTSDLFAGFGHIIAARFGSETGGGVAADDGVVAPHDIIISNSGRTNKTYGGLRIIGGTHFSKTGTSPLGSRQKVAPILLDTGINGLDVRGLSVASAYSSPYHILQKPGATATVTASLPGENVVDRLSRVEPVLRGFFKGVVQGRDKTAQVMAAAPLTPYTACYAATYDAATEAPKLAPIASASRVGEVNYVTGDYPVRQADGTYAPGTWAGNDRLHAHTVGSILDTPLDASTKAVGDPVYTSSGGALTLTQGAGAYARVIGRVLRNVVNAPILLTFEGLRSLSVTATLDFPSIAAQSTAELTIAVPGAATGDAVILSAPALTAGLQATARVSGADTVTVRVSNVTAAAIDPASASYTVRVVK